MNAKDDGYRGIWSFNGSSPSDDEYKFVHYSGGFATVFAKHIPMAYYAPEVNKTFFCYGGTRKDKNQILVMASYYDHGTGTVPRPTILVDKGTDDGHDNPVLTLDGSGFVWVFANAHGTARPAFIFKSREPYSVDDFELIQQTNFSYAQPWFIKGRGWLFLHTRYIDGYRVLHWMTSADGTEWSAPRVLASIATGHYQISWRQGRKVGTAFNYHPHERLPNDMRRTNLYYLETDDFGSTWKNAQGQAIEIPLKTAANAALVHDYESEDLRVYLKDLNFDSEGRPVILFLTSPGAASGPRNDPRIWTIAHWTGKRWDTHEITRSDNNYDTGCLHVEEDGTWRIIAPTEPGPQRYNTGGEVAVWTSSDEGHTWTKVRQVTHHSPANHSYVRRPVNAHPDFHA
ncbi:MAG: BNR-4 repeat-containing protein, partial [Lentisphaeria bacterium]|nr:BNR-4 repeat-containing protein [Lentisphaeria bacterium]